MLGDRQVTRRATESRRMRATWLYILMTMLCGSAMAADVPTTGEYDLDGNRQTAADRGTQMTCLVALLWSPIAYCCMRDNAEEAVQGHHSFLTRAMSLNAPRDFGLE